LPAEPVGTAAAPRPIVWFSIFDWWYHTHGHSDTQLALHFARERPVLFVNSIGMRVPDVRRDRTFLSRVRRKLRSATRGVRRPVPGLPLHVASVLTVPLYGGERGRRANTAFVAAQVRVLLRGLHLRDPVFVVTVPTALAVVDRLHAKPPLVYNRADDHGAFEEADQPYIRRLEGALLERADVVLYYSPSLYEREHARVGDRAVFLDHGVDTDAFRPPNGAREPDPLAGTPHPRAGFLGGVRDRVVDLELLARAARALPDVHFVLVGPVLSPLGALASCTNVHVTGPRPYDQMPAIARALDVALLPYRTTPWVQGANPVKLKEYLATGLPVVASDFPAARRYVPPIVVASTPDAFVAGVRDAAARPSTPEERATRRATVTGDAVTWAAKARVVLDRLA
jgi:glycosyltransferase involved in cell wall biosynthesis